MKFSSFVRQHWAAFRALLVLTVITGIAYPLFIWLVAQIPGLRDNANGSIIEVNGKPVGSSLIGQSFTDKDGNALPQYFQSRPSAAGNGYDPLSTGASNLGPESIVDAPDKPSLLTLVCSRSAAVLHRWLRVRGAVGDLSVLHASQCRAPDAGRQLQRTVRIDKDTVPQRL